MLLCMICREFETTSLKTYEVRSLTVVNGSACNELASEERLRLVLLWRMNGRQGVHLKYGVKTH